MPDIDRVRIDVWLDVACVFKTRSEAQRACKGGKVDINSVRAKPHREIQVGDELAITVGPGRRRLLRVNALSDQHLPKPIARTLYDDITPPPSPEEAELQELIRRAGPVAGKHRTKRSETPRSSRRPPKPSRNDRRALRRLKEH